VALTLEEFLARFDAAWVTELVERAGDTVEIRDARIERAIADAMGELEGYRPRMPAGMWPAEPTLLIHQVKVAVYLLTLDRPGKDFEQVRNAYLDTIKFYTDAIAQAAASGGGSPVAEGCAPPAVFTEQALKGFA